VKSAKLKSSQKVKSPIVYFVVYKCNHQVVLCRFKRTKLRLLFSNFILRNLPFCSQRHYYKALLFIVESSSHVYLLTVHINHLAVLFGSGLFTQAGILFYINLWYHRHT